MVIKRTSRALELQRMAAELPGIAVAWGNANQAWIITWHSTLLRVIPDFETTRGFLRTLYPDPGPARGQR